MANTLLQTVQQAAQEMGLPSPTTVIGNQATQVVQLYALANALGNEIRRQYDWQRITKEYRFTTVFYEYTGNTTEDSLSVTGMSSIVGLDSTFMVTGEGINQDTYVSTAVGNTVTLSQAATATANDVELTFAQTKYAMPSDFDRWNNRTQWDKSMHWEMLGPETGQQWQWLKSGYIATGPRVRFRPLGGYFQIWPPLSTNEYLGFEYLSNQWVLSTTDVITPTKAAFTADSDTCVFPDRLMVTGIKRKFFLVQGFGDIYKDEYDTELGLAQAYDSGAKTLSLAPRVPDQLITINNIADGNWNV